MGKGAEFIYNPVKPRIIVDKREFRSDLPSVLFHEGFEIIPITLQTGDYILSNEIGIERKAVETGDLIESLKSERLE
jgi:DNA excision repair protein ERCC-4